MQVELLEPRVAPVEEPVEAPPTPSPSSAGSSGAAPKPAAPQQSPPAAISPDPQTGTGSNTNGQSKPEQSQRDEKEKQDIAYRGGNNTNGNFTPRPGKDDKQDEDKRGLSLNVNPQVAAGNADKAQEVDLNKVDRTKFDVIKDKDGHVSIRPKTQGQLEEWSASRPDADKNPHPYTNDVRGARTGGVWEKKTGNVNYPPAQSPPSAPSQPAVQPGVDYDNFMPVDPKHPPMA